MTKEQLRKKTNELIKKLAACRESCPNCDGTGLIADDACRVCGGYGFWPGADIYEHIKTAMDLIEREN